MEDKVSEDDWDGEELPYTEVSHGARTNLAHSRKARRARTVKAQDATRYYKYSAEARACREYVARGTIGMPSTRTVLYCTVFK